MGAGTAGGRRFLRLLHDTGAKEAIFLNEYLLIGIEWKQNELGPLEDEVKVEGDQESQSDGYEVICHILEQSGIREEFQLEEDKEQFVMATTSACPKRVEATLVNRQDPQKKIRLVIVEYTPPRGAFKCHTLKGRAWVEATKRLETTIVAYHGTQWWISQVVKYVSPGQSISSFHSMTDTLAWDRIEEFLGKMQASEINVVRHFKYHHDKENEYPAIDRRSSCISGVSSHYRNPYTPDVVFFRVAGDEVGRKAFLIQAEKRVKDYLDPPTLEEFLEEAEKKAVAGDESDSEETSSAVSDSGEDASGGSKDSPELDDASSSSRGSGTNVAGGNSTALPTHDPELDSLEDDVGSAFGGVPYSPEMGGAPCSAVERSLLLFPGKKKGKTLH